MADYSVASNDAFAAFVKKSEEEEAKLQAKSSGNGGKSFTYETQQWVGLDQGQAHILRLVGNPPESLTPGFKAGPYDAHEIYFETIKDDNGDRMQLRLPCHAEDINDEHIMWRIINKVKEVDWVDDPANPGKRKRIPKHEKTLVYDKITHGGFNPADPKEADSYRYSKGWSGQQVTIMNVIDREDDWCKINKHTKLLSKKVSYKDGVAYPTVGVPSYGFLSTLKKLVKVYGSWENYDVQVVKTGQMNTPYEVKNASYYKSVGVPEIDQSKLEYISLDQSLTAEEKAYERYDIAKFYSPTSYKNLKERLGKTIQEVDSTFNTHFYQELVSLAEKEEAERKAAQEEEAANNPAPAAQTAAPVYTAVSDPAPIVESTPAYQPAPVQQPAQVAPVAEPAKVAEPVKVAEPATPAQPAVATRSTVNIGTLAPNKIAALKGWMKLTEAQKAQIKDVVLDANGAVTNVIYTENAAPQCNCNNCMMPSPQDFLSCPVCGADFE